MPRSAIRRSEKRCTRSTGSCSTARSIGRLPTKQRSFERKATKLRAQSDALDKKAQAARKSVLEATPETVATRGRAWQEALEAAHAAHTRRAELVGEPPPAPPDDLGRAKEIVAVAEALTQALAASGTPHATADTGPRRVDVEVDEAKALVANGGCRCGFGKAQSRYARRCVLSVGDRTLAWSTNETDDCRFFCEAWKRDGDCARLAGANAAGQAIADARRRLDVAEGARRDRDAKQAPVDAAKARLAAATGALGPSSPPNAPASSRAPENAPPPAATEPSCPSRVATLVLYVPAGSTVDVGGLRLSAPSGIVRVQSPPIPDCRSYY